MSTILLGCNEELVQQAYNEEVSQPQTYTYTIKIDATDSEYQVVVDSIDSYLDTGTVTIDGFEQKIWYVTGRSLNGSVRRFNGIGHISVVVLKDGENVHTESIMTSSGIQAINGL